MTTKTKNKLYKIGNSLLSELYPDRCAICGNIVASCDFICAECNEGFERKPEMFYIGSTACYSVCEYNEANKRIALGAKNDRDFHKLCFMAAEIYDLLKSFGVTEEIDVIVPAPISLVKRIKRGFNHTEKLSRHISSLSDIGVVKAVKKIRHTGEQKALTRSERLTNLKGSFAIDKRNIVRNKTVLLIDDVTTTGATLREISDLLKKEGNRVICAVFAKTPYKEKAIQSKSPP